MTKCKDCHCDCHCNEELHSHHYDGDLCTCENCECKSGKDKAEDTDKYGKTIRYVLL